MTFSVRIGIDASSSRKAMSESIKKLLKQPIKLPDNYGTMLKDIAVIAKGAAYAQAFPGNDSDDALIGLCYAMAFDVDKTIKDNNDEFWEKELENPII